MLDIIADQTMYGAVLVIFNIIPPVSRMIASEKFQPFQSRHILTSLVVEFHHDPRFPWNVKIATSVDVEIFIDFGLFDGDMLHYFGG